MINLNKTNLTHPDKSHLPLNEQSKEVLNSIIEELSSMKGEQRIDRLVEFYEFLKKQQQELELFKRYIIEKYHNGYDTEKLDILSSEVSEVELQISLIFNSIDIEY